MARISTQRTRRQRQQSGTAYVLVLAITTLLVTLGIAATQLAQGQIEQGEIEQDQAKARLAALSTLDYLHRLNHGSMTWRDGLADDTWYFLATRDDVDIWYAYADPIDGDLTDDYSEPFRLTTLAVSGNAQRIYSVEFTADDTGNLTRNASTFRQEVLSY